MLDKLEYIVSLLAGLGVLIGGFLLRQELVTVLFNLIIVMLIFYIIGLVVRIYLRAKIFPIPVEEDEAIDEDYELLDDELTEGIIESALDEESESHADEAIMFSEEEV